MSAPITTCLPIGEHNEVLIADLTPNAAVRYLLENPKSKPRWCLRKSPHDIEKCTFLHRTLQKAAGYITVRGEPAPVSITDLLQNKGLEIAMSSPETFAEWCSVAAPHEVATCRSIHLGEVRNDKTVNIEGEEGPVNVSHLLLNRGVSYLLNTKGAKGVWCNNKIIHDVLSCPYIHRRIDDHPQTVSIDDEKFPVPVKDLVKNPALNFLLENPQYAGRWCSRMVKHDSEECSFLHRLHPFVRVDGESVRINALRSNRGLKYVLEHPEAQGHWCRSTHDDDHPLETCTFIHLKDEVKRSRPEAASYRNNNNSNNHNDSANNNNTASSGAGQVSAGTRGSNSFASANASSYNNNNNSSRRGGFDGRDSRRDDRRDDRPAYANNESRPSANDRGHYNSIGGYNNDRGDNYSRGGAYERRDRERGDNDRDYNRYEPRKQASGNGNGPRRGRGGERK